MSYELRFSPQATEELEDAVEWYENHGEGLGAQLSKAVEDKIRLIERYPERYPKRRGSFRETKAYLFLSSSYTDSINQKRSSRFPLFIMLAETQKVNTENNGTANKKTGRNKHTTIS